MALRKRKGIYHCDFTVNGERHRQTLETGDKREAIQKERDLMAQAREGKLASGVTAEFSRLPFSVAAERYLEERSVTAIQATVKQETSHFKSIGDFVGAKRLNQISADDVRQYQAHRLALGRHPNTVNHEVKALLRLLRRAKLASRLRDDVRLLSVKREPRKMLTPAEKLRVFETAASKPEWDVAYSAALLTANASLRPCEIRRLKWADLDPFGRLITVRLSKTDAGTRVLPLNDEAWSAVCALKKRADAFGFYEPEHFMLPRMRPFVDGTKPMGAGGWRSAWRSLRKAAGMPKLRFYDLRHQFVTELCEAGVAEAIIRELAGHIDPEMTRHYSHPRIAARRAAVGLLGVVRPAAQTGQLEGGYGTNHVTKQLPPLTEAS
jgi:integrase